MKIKIASIVSALLALAAFLTVAGAGEENRLFQIDGKKTIPLAQAADALKQNRIVLVGEHHTSAAHHDKQLAVIRALHEAGAGVAVGMEMFRSDSQPQLDRWIAGELSEKAFARIYYDNWNYDWSLYRPILRYARENRIPVIGLNVSRDITSQVARHGFDSLTEAQRGKLEDVACRVDRTYMEFIKRAYGAHAHGSLDFTFFCEAQLVWDNIMAINTLDYLKENPDAVVVIVAGNGHVWKGGIPAQIKKRSDLPHTVILPEIPGITEPGMIDSDDADYLFLN